MDSHKRKRQANTVDAIATHFGILAKNKQVVERIRDQSIHIHTTKITRCELCAYDQNLRQITKELYFCDDCYDPLLKFLLKQQN